MSENDKSVSPWPALIVMAFILGFVISGVIRKSNLLRNDVSDLQRRIAVLESTANR